MIAAPLSPALPKPLKIVAYLFILGGILAVMDTLVGFFQGRMTINLGVLYVLIGLGLLRLSPRGLAWAKFSTWLDLVCLPIAAVFALFIPDRLQRFDVFGFNVGHMPHGLGVIFCIVLFLACCWQLSVLESGPVRRLFAS